MQIVLSDKASYGYKFPTTYWTKYTTFEPAHDLTVSDCVKKYFAQARRLEFIEARCKDGVVHIHPDYIRIYYGIDSIYTLKESAAFYSIHHKNKLYIVLRSDFIIEKFINFYKELDSVGHIPQVRDDYPLFLLQNTGGSVNLSYKLAIIKDLPMITYDYISDLINSREYLMDIRIEEFSSVELVKDSIIWVFFKSIERRKHLLSYDKFKKWCRGSNLNIRGRIRSAYCKLLKLIFFNMSIINEPST